MLNLDTHVLLFALAGKITPREEKLLRRTPWSISAIVLWEIAKLSQLGRISFGLEHPHMVAALRQVHVWPLDRHVCLRSTQLDLQSDPADELIAATSLVHDLPLVTRDRKLRASKLLRLA